MLKNLILCFCSQCMQVSSTGNPLSRNAYFAHQENERSRSLMAIENGMDIDSNEEGNCEKVLECKFVI